MEAHAQEYLHISVPGKILLTGGYLILDEKYSGLVLATTARFHATLKLDHPENTAVFLMQQLDDVECFELIVDCPQFRQQISGIVKRHDNVMLEYCLYEESHRNSYVEKTIACALNGLVGHKPKVMLESIRQLFSNKTSIHLVINGDNDFYSQRDQMARLRKPCTRENLRGLPKYSPVFFGESEYVAHKTGLGSSAALVTAICAALITFFIPKSSFAESTHQIQLIHNLSQLAHCYVQHKIGSGFDVAAACFGSQKFSRIPAALIQNFLSGISTTQDGLSSCTPAVITNCLLSIEEWQSTRGEINSELVSGLKFRLPQNFQLIMGDVSSGSSTISMAKSVLRWKNETEDSHVLIESLAEANQSVEVAFQALHQEFAENPEEIHKSRLLLAKLCVSEWADSQLTLGHLLVQLHQSFMRVRRYMKLLGKKANAPIEPDEQTRLLDATMSLPGVVMAGVPGAGGYDAVFAIVLDKLVVDHVEKLWIEWPNHQPSAPTICPLLCSEETSTALLINSSIKGHNVARGCT